MEGHYVISADVTRPMRFSTLEKTASDAKRLEPETITQRDAVAHAVAVVNLVAGSQVMRTLSEAEARSESAEALVA